MDRNRIRDIALTAAGTTLFWAVVYGIGYLVGRL